MPKNFSRKRASTSIIFYGAVLDESIGLGESRKKADGSAAASAGETPDKQA
jgi:hypothetical protein